MHVQAFLVSSAKKGTCGSQVDNLVQLYNKNHDVETEWLLFDMDGKHGQGKLRVSCELFAITK
jgi:hypothetical protein